MIAWWPFDDDYLGENRVGFVMGKTSNSKTANLLMTEVSGMNYGRFGRGVRFKKDQSDARMRINDGVDIGSSWTLSSWVRNILPPVNSGISTLYRGRYRQNNREFDRYLVLEVWTGFFIPWTATMVTPTTVLGALDFASIQSH